jgi:hypothetical protein
VAYATGKFSFGLCDYCGQRYPYNVLRKNWRGFKVCPEDYEPKEPQLEPLKYKGDAIALLEPRPDRLEPVDVYVGQPGYTYFQSIGSANNTINMTPYPGQTSVQGVGGVGTVTVLASAVVSLSGVSATAQIGAALASGNSVTIAFSESAFGVGAVGSVSVKEGSSVSVAGVSGTGSVSPVSISLVAPVSVTNVFGSGNIGNVVIPNVSFGVSGVEGSGEINGPSVTT